MLVKNFEELNLNIKPLLVYFMFYKNQKDKKRNFKYVRYFLSFLCLINRLSLFFLRKYRYLKSGTKGSWSLTPSSRDVEPLLGRIKFLDEVKYKDLIARKHSFKKCRSFQRPNSSQSVLLNTEICIINKKSTNLNPYFIFTKKSDIFRYLILLRLILHKILSNISIIKFIFMAKLPLSGPSKGQPIVVSI